MMAEPSQPALDLPKPGEVIAGKYEIVRAIGQGGMGAVYESRHLRLGQRVAIKFLHPRFVRDEAAVARFDREARNASRLSTVHAARIFDVDTTPAGVPFIVCEYLDGHELLHELQKRGPFPVKEAVDYVVQACMAMADAHALGIIHRDLKPSNLFLARQGKARLVKVLDFGISKLTTSAELDLTTTGMLVGSPRYMSPEQVDAGGAVDARTDIWSLAVILFHLLTREFPFEGANVTQIALSIALKAPRSLRDVRADLPEDLETAIEHALEKNPDDRFPTVREFARAIARFGSGHMSHAFLSHSSAPPPGYDSVAPKFSQDDETQALPEPTGKRKIAGSNPTPATPRAPAPPRRPAWPLRVALGAAVVAIAGGAIFGARALMKADDPRAPALPAPAEPVAAAPARTAAPPSPDVAHVASPEAPPSSAAATGVAEATHAAASIGSRARPPAARQAPTSELPAPTRAPAPTAAPTPTAPPTPTATPTAAPTRNPTYL